MMEKGFVTALGTPLDDEGRFIPRSMEIHVAQQLAAGAAALLCMGSMGQQPYIVNGQVPLVAQTCAQAAAGRVPVYVGVSDVSVRRVADRIASLAGLPIDGVVATASYYYALSQPEIVAFYHRIADLSPYPLYLYDLPPVTQSSFAGDTVLTLMTHPNIHGIKSANLTMLRSVMRNPACDPAFRIFFSGLDIMDAGISFGIPYMLDGMFACAPVTSAAFGRSLAAGDIAGIGRALDRILHLRDTMAKYGIWAAFTHVMNLLGCPGSFNLDFISPLQGEGREVLRQCLAEMGELP